jgi:hypothetical protein
MKYLLLGLLLFSSPVFAQTNNQPSRGELIFREDVGNGETFETVIKPNDRVRYCTTYDSGVYIYRQCY